MQGWGRRRGRFQAVALGCWLKQTAHLARAGDCGGNWPTSRRACAMEDVKSLRALVPVRLGIAMAFVARQDRGHVRGDPAGFAQ